MNKALYYTLQFTWGLPQNIAGAACALRFHTQPHHMLTFARVCEWPRQDGLALGMFIFIPQNARASWKAQVEVHEYGHTLQSIILGPLYLPTVGLASALWANTKRAAALRKQNSRSYYDFWCEKWANRLGQRALHRTPPR